VTLNLLISVIFANITGMAALHCGHPGRPANGLINGSRENLPDFYEPGAQVHYSCLERNQVLVADKVRTCLQNGTWSGLRPWCGKTFDNKSQIINFSIESNLYCYVKINSGYYVDL
jgi:Sushi repeat (SCR repeat)